MDSTRDTSSSTRDTSSSTRDTSSSTRDTSSSTRDASCGSGTSASACSPRCRAQRTGARQRRGPGDEPDHRPRWEGAERPRHSAPPVPPRPLARHLTRVRTVYEQDLTDGTAVYLPDALDRKYPRAGRECQWVSSARALSVDSRPGKTRRHHVGEETLQRAVKKAIGRAGITKAASCHTLRHAFATHLLGDSYDTQ